MTTRVLAFDVFGTVVDWFGTISREFALLETSVDAGDFALAWRAGYQSAMERVRSGELPWTRLDDLHLLILDQILIEFGLETLDEDIRRDLNLVWHRLDPWPDVVEGLTQLRRQFTIVTLSNGNLALLADMAKHGLLPWDLILSAENFHAYKPDPKTYLGVCDVFAIEPHELMMVAAHQEDLKAAKNCGCGTAYLHRPLEFGPRPPVHPDTVPTADIIADDLLDLADQLKRFP